MDRPGRSQERYSTEVVLTRFRGELTLLDSRGEGSGGGGGSQGGGYDDGGYGGPPAQGGSGGAGAGGGGPVPGGDLDDEIPF